ncbi:glycosyltransferase family 4 protein [Paenibacillus methanolicus]|uniref:Glycosyltransferase EpsD n=1 Tax=Paenibacillus methanolicus TaxID=582686 RepID=A0A5S5C8J9_9BACL|nr:glycosyltransferase family 4 protein [Paenibacillus methanolicus]TYP75664.1 glycosyltransferase EpsD [Paenibacillus methanolicus]
MSRVLVIAHLGRHFRIFGHYDFKVLVEMGHEVHIAANFNETIDNFEDSNIVKHQIDFSRNPFSIQNIKAYTQLKELFSNYNFGVIHCQSPSGGAVTRLASKKLRAKGTKVLYTAHGLHFYKGAPAINWLMYYTIEKQLGRFTDCIITINEEDYQLSKKWLRTIPSVKYIHGVGINTTRFSKPNATQKSDLRKKYGYNHNDFILFYAAELNQNKNQEFLIRGLALLIKEIPQIKLLLAGQGRAFKQLEHIVEEMKLQNHVEFLGYRKDIPDLLKIADVSVSSSRREGLPLNTLEAMATGLPLVLTNCRGNRDLVIKDVNGYVVEQNDLVNFSEAIKDLYASEELRGKYGRASLEMVRQYSLDNVKKEMKEIYKLYLEG